MLKALEWAVVFIPLFLAVMQGVYPIPSPTKWHRISGAAICVILSALIWWQQAVARREHREEIEQLPTKKQFSDLQDKFDASEKARNRMIVNLASQHPLLDALDDLDKRPVMLIDDPPKILDLNSSKAALDNIRFEKQATDAKSRLIESEMSKKAIKECSPAFEYFITALWLSLESLAKDNGDTVVASTYKGIPTAIPNTVILKNYDVIEMAGHPDWKFDISFNCLSFPEWSNVVMKVRCASAEASFEYQSANKKIFAEINIREEESYRPFFELANYKSNMHELLSILIGAQQECYPLTQPSPTPSMAASKH